MNPQSSHATEGDVQRNDKDSSNPPESSGASNTNPNKDDSEYIGDDVMFKDEGVIRIGLINIRGIPEKNENPKNEHTKAMIDATTFDHTGLTEINRQWSQLDYNHCWYNRIKSWWQNKKSSISYNNKDINNEAFQPGGTISLAKEDLTCRVFKSGQDQLLGRWSWISYRGCNNIVTTVITGYRPCRNMDGNNTNYLQHKRVLTAMDIHICPREKWLEDISLFIFQRQAESEQVIVIADFNKDINSQRMKKWANDLGLKDLLQEKIQASPPTRNNGSVPID